MTKILSLVLFLLIWTSAVGQQQDFYDLNYSDNDARWVNNNNIREKRTFEVTVSEKGDSVLELRNLTAYNLSGNISFVREFLDSDTTTYDEVINRYENNVVIETIAIMKDPYDDIKTTYKYHSDKLVMMCDYARISPSDKYILDSWTTFIYKAGKLDRVKSNNRTVSSFKLKGDTILKYNSHGGLISKYFNGKKMMQFSKDKQTRYYFNDDKELIRIINVDQRGDTLNITDFKWRNHLLASQRTKDFKGNDNTYTICKYK